MNTNETNWTRASLKFIFSFDKEVFMEYARHGFLFPMNKEEFNRYQKRTGMDYHNDNII